MPRRARVRPDDACFHLLTRGHARETLFHDPDDFTAFRDLLARYRESAPFDLFHYCLMTNHVHLLLRLPDARLLSRTIQGLLIAYWHHYRRRYHLVGHLFQNRFKSPVIDTESYLLACGRYIERNPVEAGMTPDSWSYPWSSARAYALGERDALLSPNPWYEALHPDPDRRRQLWREFLTGDDAREEAVRRDDWVTGGAAFRRAMSRAAARPAPRRRGRPRTAEPLLPFPP